MISCVRVLFLVLCFSACLECVVSLELCPRTHVHTYLVTWYLTSYDMIRSTGLIFDNLVRDPVVATATKKNRASERWSVFRASQRLRAHTCIYLAFCDF